MEIHGTQIIARQPETYSFADIDDRQSQERLNSLLAANAEINREKLLYRNHREQVEAALIKNPIPVKKAFGYFGLLLGIFPPASIFLKIFQHESHKTGLMILLFFVNVICAVAGYFSGRLVGRMVADLENRSWIQMLLLLPFVGFLWGLLTGGAGGILIFVIGAFFGAIIAAMVGGAAIPAFAVFHRLLKKGEMIERKHFLPLSFGITLIISAFILGM